MLASLLSSYLDGHNLARMFHRRPKLKNRHKLSLTHCYDEVEWLVRTLISGDLMRESLLTAYDWHSDDADE